MINQHQYDKMTHRLAAAERRVRELEEALKFYAYDENYQPVEYDGVGWSNTVDLDCGDIAQAALHKDTDHDI